MKRYLLNSLIEWKTSNTSTSLILWGVLHVGKIWPIKEFEKTKSLL